MSHSWDATGLLTPYHFLCTVASLRCVEVQLPGGEVGDPEHPGLDVDQLDSLLSSLRGLHALTLGGGLSPEETAGLLANCATNNPQLRQVEVERISAEGLTSLTELRPDLEVVKVGFPHTLTSSQVGAALARLPCLTTLGVGYLGDSAMLHVARDQEAAPLYRLTGELSLDSLEEVTPGDVTRLFSLFPDLEQLTLSSRHLPMVTAALLETNPKFTTLHLQARYSTNAAAGEVAAAAAALPSLYSSLRLTTLDVYQPCAAVDLALIGQLCTNLRNLQISADSLTWHALTDHSDTASEPSTAGEKLQYSCDVASGCTRIRTSDNVSTIGGKFRRLEHLDVTLGYSSSVPTRLPDALCYDLLSGPNLSTLDTKGLILPDCVVGRLMTAAHRGGEGVLGALREWGVEQGEVSLAGVVGVACHAPALRCLYLKYCSVGQGSTVRDSEVLRTLVARALPAVSYYGLDERDQ